MASPGPPAIAARSARSLSLFPDDLGQNQIVPFENAELELLECCIESGGETLVVGARGLGVEEGRQRSADGTSTDDAVSLHLVDRSEYIRERWH